MRVEVSSLQPKRNVSESSPRVGMVSPTLSNIVLTPFDREMRLRGYQLKRYADDWVITCNSAQRHELAVEAARAES
jgi:RNA-directed DNA polymerase